eukprot:753861-Hanusia_phi.AAC.10
MVLPSRWSPGQDRNQGGFRPLVTMRRGYFLSWKWQGGSSEGCKGGISGASQSHQLFQGGTEI